MDRLDQLKVFVQIAEMGSFIKAANRLELPRATVSAAIQQLEAAMGTRLLHRTTRTVQPTADGLLLIERARELLAHADELDGLFHARLDVTGRLTVDVPSRIARRLIAPMLPALLRRHPKLQLALRSTDRSIDLIQEGVDCVIRVGELTDSSLVVRPLGRIALINCASPGYLNEHGVPVDPRQLESGHWMVGYASPTTGRELPWEYLAEGEGHVSHVAVPSRVIVNNAENYIACCLAGVGLIQIPRFDVQYLIDQGRLVEVMPEWRAASMDVSALYPHRRQRSRRLNVFIDWFEELMQPYLERSR
ncbi:LysR family transcriptional regulator [Paraburkholderia acidicola]|uniref:LysR family transcriptional regulator n=1 Tax=Paraburkholderia acidicola TaxID=1912599 RepID=A0A2A4F3G6_9BURK|nr:LysR family transcriptional regulator [Paraburkholderia acidicola]PCE27625.1 LysR family transcriptional regulator [Paraburkholderia acidicola]